MTTYGAYSESQIYKPADVKDFVLYSRLRGVKIIPELDSPAHAVIDQTILIIHSSHMLENKLINFRVRVGNGVQ